MSGLQRQGLAFWPDPHSHRTSNRDRPEGLTQGGP